MRTLRNVIALALVGSALGVSGCGSSGSDNSTAAIPPAVVQPPADDTPVDDMPPAGGERITVHGKVTDAPIPNATVVLTVDGQSFTAALPTAADGSYEVEIESSNPDAMVLCEAVDPNGTAHFTAMVDSFSGFQAKADEEGNVDDVQITNVTTAQFVLASRLTDDGTIDSIEELEEVSDSVETEDLLELSAAIKLVVENIDGIVLPSDISDTRDLAEAIVDGTTSFIADVELSNPGALNTAEDLVLSDGNATIAWTADAVPGAYFSTDGFSMFAFLDGGVGHRMDFDADEVVDFQWAVSEEGELSIDFADGDSEAVKLLSRTGDVVNVVVRGDNASGEASTAYYYSFDRPFDALTVPGSYSSTEEAGEYKVFLADGSGYDLNVLNGEQGSFFDWTVDEDGALNFFEQDRDESVRVFRMSGSDTENMNLLVLESDPASGAVTSIEVIHVLRTEDILSGAVEDGAAALALAGATYAITDPDDLALVTFRVDGGFHEVGQQFEADGMVHAYEDSGAWTVLEGDVVSIQFPDEDEADLAVILDGLGTDTMLVESGEELESEQVQLTRVVPVELELVPGTYEVLSDDGSAATVVLNSDRSGVYSEPNEETEYFSWSVNASGQLVIDEPSDSSFDRTTMTMYLLAGGSGDLMSFVSVRRVNGVLDVEMHDGGGDSMDGSDVNPDGTSASTDASGDGSADGSSVNPDGTSADDPSAEPAPTMADYDDGPDGAMELITLLRLQ